MRKLTLTLLLVIGCVVSGWAEHVIDDKGLVLRINGSTISYNLAGKSPSEYDYVVITGKTKPIFKEDGTPEWYFKDESDIKRVTRYYRAWNREYIVEKENSRWLLSFTRYLPDGFIPTVYLIEPVIEEKEEDYLKVLYEKKP